MRITFLSENCRADDRQDLSTEHGLSLYIEHDGIRILFDAGASDRFLRNADIMNIDLNEANYAVLSHGHYDHGGGLRYFLETNQEAPVLLAERAFSELYNIAGAEPRAIGLDAKLQSDFPDRFRLIRQLTEISANVWIIADIPRVFPEPVGNRTLTVKEGDAYVPDDFRHELILCILANDRLFCFTGCSHNGVLNMLAAVDHQFPSQKKVLISGFHMMNPRTGLLEESVDTVRQVAEAIRDNNTVETVITCHCTGQEAYGILKGVLGEKLNYGATGAVFEY